MQEAVVDVEQKERRRKEERRKGTRKRVGWWCKEGKRDNEIGAIADIVTSTGAPAFGSHNAGVDGPRPRDCDPLVWRKGWSVHHCPQSR